MCVRRSQATPPYKSNPHKFYEELRPALQGLEYNKRPDGYEYDETKAAVVKATTDLIEHLLQVAESGRASPPEKL